MEDLRWACMSVDLRAVRAALAVGGRSAARPGRAGSTGEPAAKAARPALDLAERDPLAGSTVLHFACNPAVGAQPRAHLPILRLLLSHGAGAFVDERNNVGDTALIVCARQGDSDGLLLLLEAGADPSVKNRFGDTALHVAARLGHADLIVSLLEWKGVDTGATNCLGKTAGQIANSRVRRLIGSADPAGGNRVAKRGTAGEARSARQPANSSACGPRVVAGSPSSKQSADTGSTKQRTKAGVQAAKRRACDIVASGSTPRAGYDAGRGQEAPSPAPPPPAVLAMAHAQSASAAALPEPPRSQTLAKRARTKATSWTATDPTAATTTAASPRDPTPRVDSPTAATTTAASPKASGSKVRKKSRQLGPRQCRSWTPDQVRSMHRHPSVGSVPSRKAHAGRLLRRTGSCGKR